MKLCPLGEIHAFCSQSSSPLASPVSAFCSVPITCSSDWEKSWKWPHDRSGSNCCSQERWITTDREGTAGQERRKGERVEEEMERIISREMGGGNIKGSLLTGKETDDRWLKVGSLVQNAREKFVGLARQRRNVEQTGVW